MSLPCDPCREIRIKSVSHSAFKMIKNISGRMGVTTSRFVREKLKEIIAENTKRSPVPCEACGEMEVVGVGEKTKKEWQKLAEYYKVDVSSVIKIKLMDAIDAMPAHLKVEMPQD